METKFFRQQEDSGFALLIALIVVGVVLSVGLTILDLSIKQVRLSTNAKDSELAFQAANAGMECARYWRRAEADAMERGQNISPECFDESAYTDSNSQISSGVIGDGEVFQYQYSFSWGGTNPRCTEINTLVASSSPFGVGVTTTAMTTLVPGFPDGDAKYCEAGTKCSTISVRGYNRPCSTIGGYGVVQREVLLEF